MIIVDDPIVVFDPDKAVPPEDVNRVFRYIEEAIADAGEIRYSCIPLTLQFSDTCGTQLTSAQASAFRTIRFAAPVSGVIQRAFVVGSGIFSDRVDVDIVIAGTSTRPVGAPTPYLALTQDSPVDPLDGDVSDINVQKVTLVAGTFYDVVVSAPAGGSFALDRLDVTLNIVVDAYAVTGTVDEPSFDFDPYVDGVADGDDIDSDDGNSSGQVTKTFGAVGRSCLILMARNFTNGTNIDFRQRMLPQMDPNRASAIIERIYLGCTTTTTTGTVTATLQNSVGTTVATVVTPTIVSSPTSADSGPLSIALDNGNPSVNSNDFQVTFSTTRASAVTRAFVVIWIKHR